MKAVGVVVVLLFVSVVYCANVTSVVDFANNNWMCADISCSEYVFIYLDILSI